MTAMLTAQLTAADTVNSMVSFFVHGIFIIPPRFLVYHLFKILLCEKNLVYLFRLELEQFFHAPNFSERKLSPSRFVQFSVKPR